MDDKRLLFVYNSHSGKGKIKSHMVDVLEIFSEAGYEVVTYPTKCKGDATRIIESKGKEFDLIVCSGGDGTLDESVEGMITGNLDIPLGYIPAGSTNDYARSLNIPTDMKKAAHISVNGTPRFVDVGVFNDKHFVYVAAFGVFTDVSYETSQDIKNLFGHGAYVFEGVKSISEGGLRPIPMTIIADDQLIKDTFAYGMICNSKSVGGYKSIGFMEAEPDDGLFEGVFIKFPEDPTALNAVLTSLFYGEPDPELVYFVKASEFSLRTRIPEKYSLDGENGGVHSDVEIKVLKQKIKLMV